MNRKRSKRLNGEFKLVNVVTSKPLHFIFFEESRKNRVLTRF